MTVGIAALALRGKAIALMADKLITEKGDLKIEREQTKGAFLPNGWLALYAGGTTFADAVLAHVPAVFEKAVEEKGHSLGLAFEVMDAFHRGYLDIWDFFVEHEVLRPRLLTAEQYRTGEGGEARELIEAERKAYEEDVAPEFLLAGFDDDGVGHVMEVGLRTMEETLSFGAIGSGAETARARLLWQKTSPDDELARVVYEVYTAKSHAEMEIHVGAKFDAFVMYGNGEANLRAISPKTKELLRTVFRHNDQSPFRIARRPEEEAPPPPPPDNWERDFIDKILPLPEHLAEIRKSILGKGWDS